jgi:hypothetical protein
MLRRVEIATERAARRVEKLIHADRRIMIDSEAAALGSSRGLANNIMHDHLEFWKLYVLWVPRELKYRTNVCIFIQLIRMLLSLMYIFMCVKSG